MSAIADELAFRASPGQVRARVREEAVRRGTVMGDNALRSKRFMGTASGVTGGIVGALAGAALASFYDRSRPHPYQTSKTEYRSAPSTSESYEGFESEWSSPTFEESSVEGPSHPSGRERISSAISSARQRASESAADLKSRVSGAMESVRGEARHLSERLPSGDEIRSRGSEYASKAQERPLALLAGGIAVGVLLAVLVPVTDTERRTLAPIRSKARESLRNMSDNLGDRFAGSDIGSSGESSGVPTPSGSSSSVYETPTVH